MVKIGINGFGRIGRLVFRASLTKEGAQVVFCFLLVFLKFEFFDETRESLFQKLLKKI